MSGIDVLETTHAIRILLVLRDNGSMVKGDLARAIAKGTATVQSRVADLVDSGLVTETRETTKPFRIYVELTPKGREIADLLCELESLFRRRSTDLTDRRIPGASSTVPSQTITAGCPSIRRNHDG
ncbi:MAG: winged helix-turn-helix transcriptional regulator [Candidatus Methanomethylophilaceae archaeon]|nr:winged helix-turn-helix transcriptional regulator [Candidatus Methanomethylophilaceae archaeon]